ncbi:hypothetical protein [Chelativorans sp. AA-79]|uniref:hypothetical protein n=1 Tax=Chelativorans sp. AA-79 TaxID=3028735 RepID=UPI0023F8539A|nr:hypothetical protein [Chelativorans sp. AA-79]WEX10192.1 hypothetical protein PVE73_04330 [Chelativorans sp. AA-79]
MSELDRMRNPNEGAGAVAVLLYITVGLFLWGLHLTIVYAAHTAICALAAAPAAATVTIAAVTVLLALPLAAILFNQRRFARLLGIGETVTEPRIYDAISFFVNLLSLVGILWSGLAVAMLSSCILAR